MVWDGWMDDSILLLPEAMPVRVSRISNYLTFQKTIKERRIWSCLAGPPKKEKIKKAHDLHAIFIDHHHHHRPTYVYIFAVKSTIHPLCQTPSWWSFSNSYSNRQRPDGSEHSILLLCIYDMSAWTWILLLFFIYIGFSCSRQHWTRPVDQLCARHISRLPCLVRFQCRQSVRNWGTRARNSEKDESLFYPSIFIFFFVGKNAKSVPVIYLICN